MASVSMKLKNLTKIKNEIASIIDSNQNIKRYCKYMTNTPLLSMGMALDGSMKKQVDISDTLIDKNIIPYRFMEDILTESNVIIFVYFDEAELSNKSPLGYYKFSIDVFVPKKYDSLKELGQERNIEIITTIADLLDNEKLPDNLGLGSVDIVYGRQTRLTNKSDYTIFSLDLNIKGSNFRISRC